MGSGGARFPSIDYVGRSNLCSNGTHKGTEWIRLPDWLRLVYVFAAIVAVAWAFPKVVEANRQARWATALGALALLLLIIPEISVIRFFTGLGMTGTVGAWLTALFYRPTQLAAGFYGLLVAAALALAVAATRRRKSRGT